MTVSSEPVSQTASAYFIGENVSDATRQLFEIINAEIARSGVTKEEFEARAIQQQEQVASIFVHDASVEDSLRREEAKHDVERMKRRGIKERVGSRMAEERKFAVESAKKHHKMADLIRDGMLQQLAYGKVLQGVNREDISDIITAIFALSLRNEEVSNFFALIDHSIDHAESVSPTEYARFLRAMQPKSIKTPEQRQIEAEQRRVAAAANESAADIRKAEKAKKENAEQESLREAARAKAAERAKYNLAERIIKSALHESQRTLKVHGEQRDTLLLALGSFASQWEHAEDAEVRALAQKELFGQIVQVLGLEKFAGENKLPAGLEIKPRSLTPPQNEALAQAMESSNYGVLVAYALRAPHSPRLSRDAAAQEQDTSNLYCLIREAEDQSNPNLRRRAQNMLNNAPAVLDKNSDGQSGQFGLWGI